MKHLWKAIGLVLIVTILLGACQPTPELTEMPTEPPATEPPAEEPTPEPTTEELTPEPTTEEMTPEPTPEPFEAVVDVQMVAEGLTAPVDLTGAGDGTGRRFIVEQVGTIRILTAEGELLEEPFLDISDRMVDLNPGYDERGLLGLAFHPNYADNGRFYVYYSAPLRPEAPAGWNHTSHLSEFTVSDDANLADPTTERVILMVDQPQSNHNAGQIKFGLNDAYLYVPLGDGGGAGDVDAGHVPDWYDANEGGNGQDVADNLLGSILRLDVDGGDPYAVPEDNPFVGDDMVLDEIFAYGFRNPYRMTFDPAGDNEIFVGDAGQVMWEEVDIVERGGNYGWNVREGSHCFNASDMDDPLEECPDTDPEGDPLIGPILEYRTGHPPEGRGAVVIGGYVYRGEMLPEGFGGRYVFGDWSTRFDEGNGTLFVAERPEAEGEMWPFDELQVGNSENGRINAYLLSFGQDDDLNLYVLTSDTPGPQGETGKVYMLVPPGEGEMEDGEEEMMEEVEVEMIETAFEPTEITVGPGTTVTWINRDSFDHTVTSGVRGEPTDLFDETVPAGESFSYTFEEPGTYEYFCSLHPGMDGTVIVEE